MGQRLQRTPAHDLMGYTQISSTTILAMLLVGREESEEADEDDEDKEAELDDEGLIRGIGEAKAVRCEGDVPRCLCPLSCFRLCCCCCC